jgi:hypothetical protein
VPRQIIWYEAIPRRGQKIAKLFLPTSLARFLMLFCNYFVEFHPTEDFPMK